MRTSCHHYRRSATRQSQTTGGVSPDWLGACWHASPFFCIYPKLPGGLADTDLDRETLQRAAAIAAYQSTARTAWAAAVSGTRVRDISKLQGRKPAPYRSATSRCAKSTRRVATWLESLATPLPRLSGALRSRALARAPGRACRPGQRPQPPDGRGLLLGFQRLGEGHELPKRQEGHPRGHEATERRHPAIDGGYQPVQQQSQAQPAPADPAQEEPKHGDAAQHRRASPFPSS